MSTQLTVYVNTGTLDAERGSSAVEFTEMNLTNDYMVFSAGSDTVKDGEPLPTPQQLNSAAPLITTVDVEIAHYFLADASDNELKEISLGGNQNARYVFCFSFDGATASEPVLELWDDDDLDSIDTYSLGEGDANSSFFRGIVTTDSLPGASWTGTRLAGSSDNHFLWLNNNNGELTTAKDLYCNLRATIPADFGQASAETPVIAIKYTTN